MKATVSDIMTDEHDQYNQYELELNIMNVSGKRIKIFDHDYSPDTDPLPKLRLDESKNDLNNSNVIEHDYYVETKDAKKEGEISEKISELVIVFKNISAKTEHMRRLVRYYHNILLKQEHETTFDDIVALIIDKYTVTNHKSGSNHKSDSNHTKLHKLLNDIRSENRRSR